MPCLSARAFFLGAVRDCDWKLIGNVRGTSNPKLVGAAATARVFLSNTGRDSGELKNYASEYPEIVTRLKAAHDSF